MVVLQFDTDVVVRVRVKLRLPDLVALLHRVVAIVVVVHVDEVEVDVGVDVAAAICRAADALPAALLAVAVVLQALGSAGDDLALAAGARASDGVGRELAASLGIETALDESLRDGTIVHLLLDPVLVVFTQSDGGVASACPVSAEF